MSTSAAVRRWQNTQVARGECRQCGTRLAPDSKSRCWTCLERARIAARRRCGIMTGGKRKRGRPMLGTLAERRRDLREEDKRQRRRRDGDAAPPTQKRLAPVSRRWRFVQVSAVEYRVVWESDG